MKITVYLGSFTGKNRKYAEKVSELGRWIGENGHDLVYGGSKVGLMGIIADAVLKAGGKVTGVEPGFFVESARQHENLTELIVTKDMSERKKVMIDLSEVFIAFPGGLGTLEEISEIMSHNGIGLFDKLCLIYNLDHYYDGLKMLLDHMTEEGFIPEINREKVHFVSSIEEIDEAVRQKLTT